MAVRSTWAIAVLRSSRWAFFLLILSYAAFALSAAGTEVLNQLGLAEGAPFRSAPNFFIVHALAGTAALVTGPLQWIRALRSRGANSHRWIGRVYVGGVVVAAVSALRMALTFDVPMAGRASFATLAILWITSTVVGLRRILEGRVASHRAWMTRSYALTLFFLTGPIAMAVADSGVWAYEVAYPVAITLAWGVNLAAAEAWIRWRYQPRPMPLNA